MQKTNAMRILDKLKTPHECLEYPHGGTALEGTEVARLLGQDPACVFKTLATSGAGGVFIFVIPVNRELDLKKAAAGEIGGDAAGCKACADGGLCAGRLLAYRHEKAVCYRF